MKLDIKTMLITLGVCILFAFTATDIMTVVPAKPKLTIALKCDSSAAVELIGKYTMSGYVVKSYTAGTNYSREGLLIMEKY